MKIGFDFDGVLCPTPFGRLAVHAPEPVDDLPEDYESLYAASRRTNPLRLAMEYARFAWRSADAHALELLQNLARGNDLYVVTGRSRKGEPLMERWLKSRGWRDYISGVYMAPGGLRPAQHKLAVARMLGIGAHIDDDPRTAYHLAQNGIRAYLLDHANAHGDAPLPENLTLVTSLKDFATKIADERA